MNRSCFARLAVPTGALGVTLLLTAPACHALEPGAAPPTLACPERPVEGSEVLDAESFHSEQGSLQVDLSFRRSLDSQGRQHYCFVSSHGTESPTLRVRPGDSVVLRLENDVSDSARAAPPSDKHPVAANDCTGGAMDASSTNLHFHGLDIPPVCHQDDVLNTSVSPKDKAFEYRFRIPEDEPPGLYWYHPHVHGFTRTQVLGGASGALIVEGIERANTTLAGLPERVLVIRDEDLFNPDAQEVHSDSMPAPMVLRDAEGDIMNTGNGGGKPAKDLSINYVPVTFPKYTPAVIRLRPGERQLWRILNASAITYLDLQLLINNQLQALGVVALDSVPLKKDGTTGRQVLWQSHALIPPAGRVEVIVKTPPTGVSASLVTRTVDTGPAGENDPTRPLATIVAETAAPDPTPHLESSPAPLPPSRTKWLGDTRPVRTRKLFFSEKPHDAADPNSPTEFYITVEGQKPKLFSMASKQPNILVHQGDVEDWIIENRTQELHAFHIHQIHFILREWNGIPLNEPYLRDTVNVAYWDGHSDQFPSVKLRMDFRNPNAVGTFVYHCHLLEHEDGGMMGLIRVLPRHSSATRSSHPRHSGSSPIAGPSYDSNPPPLP
jgi:prepilin-type processing-associated H-X9-DG protein